MIAWDVTFAPDAITFYAAALDAPCQDVLRLAPTPDDADRLADRIHEWAAIARAREHANDVPPLLALLA